MNINVTILKHWVKYIQHTMESKLVVILIIPQNDVGSTEKDGRYEQYDNYRIYISLFHIVFWVLIILWHFIMAALVIQFNNE